MPDMIRPTLSTVEKNLFPNPNANNLSLINSFSLVSLILTQLHEEKECKLGNAQNVLLHSRQCYKNKPTTPQRCFRLCTTTVTVNLPTNEIVYTDTA